jgi:GNAT superfamily N-acetyltransferase
MAGNLPRALDLLRLVFTGRGRRMWSAVTYLLYSDSASVGLRRDLSVPHAAPTAKRPIEVRPLMPDDALPWLDVRDPGLSDEQVYVRLGQARLLRSGIRTCHVAVEPDGTACYMQWLILSNQNDQLRAFFGNLYPRLAPDEALLEGAYTPEAYRGQGVMAAAMAQIAERADQFGARWVVTFVAEGNAASLKGCARAGFVPYLRRHERFRLFHRRVWFTPVSPAASSPNDRWLLPSPARG